jgi:hypothetical protein
MRHSRFCRRHPRPPLSSNSQFAKLSALRRLFRSELPEQARSWPQKGDRSTRNALGNLSASCTTILHDFANIRVALLARTVWRINSPNYRENCIHPVAVVAFLHTAICPRRFDLCIKQRARLVCATERFGVDPCLLWTSIFALLVCKCKQRNIICK